MTEKVSLSYRVQKWDNHVAQIDAIILSGYADSHSLLLSGIWFGAIKTFSRIA